MNKFIRPLALFCLPVLPASLTHATFSTATVAADSRWVVHVDLDTLRETDPGKRMLAALNTSQLGKIQGNIKLDFQKVLATIGSVTAYGSNFSQDPKTVDGTLLIQGTTDLRKIAEGLVAETTVSHPENISEIKDLPFEAYSVRGNKDGTTLIVGFPKEPIILIGKSKPHLQRAYDVFRGKAKSLPVGSGLGALIPKDPNAYLIAASVIPSDDVFPANAPQARILQMASAGSLAVGDNKNLTYARLQLVSSSGEMADKLMKIIQGMTAMLSLTESNDKRLEEFTKSVTVERHNNTVQLGMSYPSERLAQMINSIHDDETHEPIAPPVREKAIETWTANQKVEASGLRGAELLMTRTIENVQLSTGTTLILSARRSGKSAARIDFVEIIGHQPGAAPLHFEAESLKYNGYRPEPASFASGGKVIALNNQNGSARFQFPGLDGMYTVKVCYLDEPDGSSTFTLTTRDPEPVPRD